MTVHVLSVVFSSMPKNRLTSQKPESLTWESTVAPAASANTSNATLKLLRSCSPTWTAMRPAVVVNATVAEPWATRSAVAMRNACSMSGSPRSESEDVSDWPIPLARKTPPNMPPAPVMRMIEQTGPRA